MAASEGGHGEFWDVIGRVEKLKLRYAESFSISASDNS
jgi:hypothetical protein